MGIFEENKLNSQTGNQMWFILGLKCHQNVDGERYF